MSGAEAAFVIGLISGVVTVIQSTKTVYDAAKDAQGLPNAFRQVAERLPLVNNTLGIIQKQLDGDIDEASIDAMEPVIKSCKEKATRLDEIFRKCIPDAKASTLDRYFKAVRTLGKDHMVETLMKGMLVEVQLLAGNHSIKSATKEQVGKLEEAIAAVSAIESSVPDDTPERGGFTNINSGYQSKQINNQALGNQTSYTAETQTFQQGNQFGHVFANYLNIDNRVSDIEADLIRKRQEVLAWLSNIDIVSNHNAACKLREPTTGNWFIQSSDFVDWKAKPHTFMLLSGFAGSGKTILCSTIIEEMGRIHQEGSSDDMFAYYYFTFQEKEKQTVAGFLGSIAGQFYAAQQSLPHEIHKIYEQSTKSSQRPSVPTLIKCLVYLLSLPGKKYVVVDALDECEERETLLDILSELWEIKTQSIHILATSRPELEIVQELRPILTQDISLTDSKIEVDIALHIHKQVFKHPKLKPWPNKVKVEIEQKLREKAQGMFRWVYCQLKTLKSCRKLSVLQKTLDQLPTDLDETYSRIIENIEKQHSKEALRALQWLAFSVRPLTLVELAEAAILEPSIGSLEDRDPLRDPSDILAICSSLVVIGRGDTFHEVDIEDSDADAGDWRFGEDPKDIEEREEEEDQGAGDTTEGSEDSEFEEDGEDEEEENRYAKLPGDSVVSFAHFSVKEYLISDRVRIISESGSHALIGQTCLSYLLLFDSSDTSSKKAVEEFPLHGYAVRHWPKHARVAESNNAYSEETVSLALRLLDSGNRAFINWIRFRYRGGLPASKLTESISTPPLYYAARLSLPRTVDGMLKLRNLDVNAKGGRNKYALSAAASWQPDLVLQSQLAYTKESSSEVAQKLLESGANIHAKGRNGDTALHSAVRGNKFVLQLLLQRGAMIEMKNDDEETPLHVAARDNYHESARLLIEHGGNVHAKQKRGMTPLHLAAQFGHKVVAELLLENGAMVDEKEDEEGVTPLHCAASRGNADVAELLLEHGADIEAKSNEGWRPLQLATKNVGVMRVLLKKGADINAKSGGHTALYYATLTADDVAVTVLLESGAETHDIPSKKAGYWISQHSFNNTLREIEQWNERSNLFKAAYGGNILAVKRLLVTGKVDIHAKDEGGGTALHRAVSGGCSSISIVGGYIQSKDQSELDLYEDIVELLIENGADLEAKDSKGETALHIAVDDYLRWHCGEKIVRLLLEKGADSKKVDAEKLKGLLEMIVKDEEEEEGEEEGE